MVITRPLQKDPNQIKRIMMVLGKGYSAEAKAAFALYDSLGDGLTQPEKVAMAAYIDAEVIMGNHAKKDYELIMSLSGANALVDYIGGKVATAVNAPTHSVNGFTLDGATNYIDSNFNPTTHGVNYKQDDAIFGVFIKSWNTGTPGALCGAFDTPFRMRLVLSGDAAQINTGVNSANNDNNPATIDITSALHLLARVDADDILWYENGSLQDTFAETSTGVPDINIFMGCRNSSGTPELFSPGTFSAFIVGGGIGFDHAAYDTNMSALLTALGAL